MKTVKNWFFNIRFSFRVLSFFLFDGYNNLCISTYYHLIIQDACENHMKLVLKLSTNNSTQVVRSLRPIRPTPHISHCNA